MTILDGVPNVAPKVYLARIFALKARDKIIDYKTQTGVGLRYLGKSGNRNYCGLDRNMFSYGDGKAEVQLAVANSDQYACLGKNKSLCGDLKRWLASKCCFQESKP